MLHISNTIFHPSLPSMLISLLEVILAVLLCGAMLFLTIRWFVHTMRQDIRDFRRMKEQIIDPIIKPTGFEERYWDQKTGLPRGIVDKDGQQSKNAEALFSWHPIMVACAIAAIIILSYTIGDNIPALFAIVTIPILITYLVFRFARSENRNSFTLEDDDDFWHIKTRH